MNMGWRSPPRVKPKPLHHETPKRDQNLTNGLETESQSDESNKNSEGSSSESEVLYMSFLMLLFSLSLCNYYYLQCITPMNTMDLHIIGIGIS